MSCFDAEHDVVTMTGRLGEQVVGRRVCLDCNEIVGPVKLCGARTRAGKACRVVVRAELGYTRCWSHGEGAGRTNRPRRRA